MTNSCPLILIDAIALLKKRYFVFFDVIQITTNSAHWQLYHQKKNLVFSQISQFMAITLTAIYLIVS
jgi:hypothetical protein